MVDGQYERIETDSTADLQLSVTDSLELGAAADERVSDAEYGEASDILDEDIGVAGALDAVPESPTSARQEVSNMYQAVPQSSDQADVESLGDGRQIPVDARSS